MFLDTLLQSTALKSSGPTCTDYLFVKVRVLKIRNNDIRNKKQNRKIILCAWELIEFVYKLQLHYDIYMLVFPIWMVKIIKLQIPIVSCKLCAKRNIP